MSERGFTLIEMMIYIGIVGSVLATMFAFTMNMMQSQSKVRAYAAIAYNANLIQDRLEDAARHAILVNTGTSSFGVNPSVLSLAMADAAVSPTIFSLTGVNGSMQVKQSSGAPVILTTSNVKMTNFVVSNLTTLKDVGIIQVNFSLQTINNSGRPYDDAQGSFQTTLRIPLDQ